LAPAVLLLAGSAASAAEMYLSATLDIFDSKGNVIATTGTITAGAAVSGQIYAIVGAGNSAEFGSLSALTTGGTSSPGAGQAFSTFGIEEDGGSNFDLFFSWDPTGNDPYTSFAGNPPGSFMPYINPPTQGTYTYSMTAFLAPALVAAGDKAVLSFATTAPEPASLFLLASGGLMVTAAGKFGRRKFAGK
jgi:hypothetical protein